MSHDCRSWQSIALRHVIIMGLAMVALSYSIAFGQFSTGQISGFVKDSSGLVIPGVIVVATNEGTGQTAQAITNSEGYYVFPTLMAADYMVTVELAGFKRFSVSRIEVTGAAKITVDARLEPGGLQETVEVLADASAVRSESATLGQLVGRREIDQLPASGGNAVTFARLRAGVIGGRMSDFAGVSIGTGVSSISGGRANEVLVNVDGAIANRTRSTDNTMLGMQDASTVQEVEVLTANYSAEFGRASGGVIRMVTRSGTRDFHGTLTELFQNSALNANTWARNSSGNPRLASKQAPYRYNQFGFVVSGPVYIPGVFNSDRSKLFFTWGESWVRRGSTNQTTLTVPTAKMRTGDLSELLDPTNAFFKRTRVVNDPLTGKPFPNNVIPATRLSPIGQKLLAFYPLPAPGFLEGTNNFIDTYAAWQKMRRDTLRVDYVINSRHSLSFRGTRIPNHFRTEDVRNGEFNSRPNRTAVVSLISNFSSFLNEFTASANSDGYGTMERDPECGPRCDRSTYGINYPFLYPANLKLAPEKPPSITVTGLSTFDFGPYPGYWAGQILQFGDNMTKILHSHTLKWGVVVEMAGQNDKIQLTSATAPATVNENGQFRFLDSGHPSTTGLAMGNVLMGYFNDYSEIGAKPMTPFWSQSFDWFVQDSWKATQKLTLEMGMRYSYWPTWYSKWNTLAMFNSTYYNPANAPKVNPKDGSIVSGTGDRYNGLDIPGCQPEKSALDRFPFLADYTRLYHCSESGFSPTRKNGFQPRFGLGYALNQKTAVRAGVGMFLNRLAVNRDTALGGNPPFEEGMTVFNGNADSPGGATRRIYPFTMTMQDPVLKTPVAWTWNMTVQRQLPWSIALEGAYVGRRAYNNQRKRNLNQALPGTIQANAGVNTNALLPYYGMGIIGLSENAGVARYNGMQIAMTRRMKTGLGFNVAYTYSKNKDNGSNETDPLPNSYNDKDYYGISNLDRRHVLMVTYMYDVPAMNSVGPLRHLFKDWAISAINQFQSGAPFSVTYSADYAGGGAGSGAQFWNQVKDASMEQTPFTTSTVWFDKTAFTQPAAGTYGKQYRNGLTHPGFWEINLSLRRSFRLAENKSFDFRWEAFNVLNHPNLGSANSNPTSGSFGLVTSKSGNRTMQFLLQIKF